MKRIVLLLVLAIMFSIAPTQKSHAIVWVVVKAAAKKIIKAIDLQVQRLQNKTIVLQNAQKALENELSHLKLTEINDWLEKQQKQYSIYYEELSKVRNAIAYYRRIKSIIQQQVEIINAYKRAIGYYENSSLFSIHEIEAMARVYQGILEESLNNLDELHLVIRSLSTKMSDGARLNIIASAGNKISLNYSHLIQFTQSNDLLLRQRKQQQMENTNLRKLYGIP